jgi:hypothetical protein
MRASPWMWEDVDEHELNEQEAAGLSTTTTTAGASARRDSCVRCQT